MDEADEMLSAGFKDQIYKIFQYMQNDVQIGLFSATVPESAPKATPFDILVCESPPIMIAQSSIVMSFNTL